MLNSENSQSGHSAQQKPSIGTGRITLQGTKKMSKYAFVGGLVKNERQLISVSLLLGRCCCDSFTSSKMDQYIVIASLERKDVLLR